MRHSHSRLRKDTIEYIGERSFSSLHPTHTQRRARSCKDIMRNIAAMRIIPQMDANASLRTTFCGATTTREVLQKGFGSERALSAGEMRNGKWSGTRTTFTWWWMTLIANWAIWRGETSTCPLWPPNSCSIEFASLLHYGFCLLNIITGKIDFVFSGLNFVNRQPTWGGNNGSNLKEI